MKTTTTEKSNSFLRLFNLKKRPHSFNSLLGITAIALAFLIVSSCGLHIEKRRYTKGFNISLIKKMKSSEEKAPENRLEEFTATIANESSEEHVFGTYEAQRTFQEDKFEEADYIAAFNDQVENSQKAVNSKELKTEAVNNIAQHKKAVSIAKNTVKCFTKNPKSSSNGDAHMFLLAGLVGVSSAVFIQKKRKTTLKYTRWAHKNKLKSRSLIVLGQLGLGYVGYSLGGHLKEFGYEISETSSYLVAGVTSATFLHMYMKERTKRNMWDLKAFFREKVGHVVLSACLLGSSMSIGNGVASNFLQKGTMGQLIESTSLMHKQDVKVPKADESEKHAMNKVDEPVDDSTTEVAGIIVLYVLLGLILTIGLAILSCAAICSYGEIGLLALVGSIIVLVGFNVGMNFWIRKVKKR